MVRHALVIALAVAAFTGSPRASRAESFVATVDLSVTLAASVGEVEPGETVVLTARAQNDGDFGAHTIVVSLTIPAELTVVSFAAAPGTTFDPETGMWSIDQLDSFSSGRALSVTVEASSQGEFSAVAELMSFEASYSAWDRDSTPGNANPCEDDYASVTIRVAAASDPDAGPADPAPNCTPDAGVPRPRPDAGVTDGGGGAAADDDMVGCSCRSGADGNAPALLVILFAAVVATRRRSHRARRNRGLDS